MSARPDEWPTRELYSVEFFLLVPRARRDEACHDGAAIDRMRGAFPTHIAAPRFTAERAPINSMDPSVATRLTRLLSDAPDLRATVDRLRRSNERPAASSWHGFCTVPPPLRQQQREGSSAAENSLAPQSIILGEIERVQANHGASVRILAVWPPGTTAPLKEPPVESRGVGVRAVSARRLSVGVSTVQRPSVSLRVGPACR